MALMVNKCFHKVGGYESGVPVCVTVDGGHNRNLSGIGGWCPVFVLVGVGVMVQGVGE